MLAAPKNTVLFLPTDEGQSNLTLTVKEELVLPIQLIFSYGFFFFNGFQSLLKRAAKLALNSVSWIAFNSSNKAKASSLDRSGFFTSCCYLARISKKLKNVLLL